MPSQELKNSIAELGGTIVEGAVRVALLNIKLDLAMGHIRVLLAMCEHGGPVMTAPGHVCGPEGNCDQECVAAFYDAEAMLAAKKFLEDKK